MKRVLVILGVACALAGCKKSTTATNQTGSTSTSAATPPKGSGTSFAIEVPTGPIAAPKPLSKAEKKQYQGALADGRKAAKKGDQRAAVAAFQRALAVSPDDPATLSELGLALFHGGDLEHAEAISRRAVDAAKDPRMQAASLYNLGLVQEKRANKDAAIASYKKSMELRPSRGAREALARLDPAAAAAVDPLRPRPLAGPFADARAMCDDLGDDNTDADRCPNADYKETKLEKPAAPFTDAIVFQDATQTCHLALRLAAGWFSDKDGWLCDYQNEIVFDSMTVEDLAPGGTKELVVRRCDDEMYREDVEGDDGETLRPLMSHTSRAWTVCGVGASGKPSCAEIPVAGGGDACGDKITFGWELRPTFAAGTVELKGKGKLGESAALAGSHPFVFP